MAEQIPVKRGRPKRNPRGAGRKPAMTEEKIKLVEEAWELGATDEEACLNAGVSRPTLLAYLKNPEVAERKYLLKNQMILTARKTISVAVRQSPDHAWKYLERKKRDEFGEDKETESSTLTVRTLEAIFNREAPTLKEQTIRIHTQRQTPTSQNLLDSIETPPADETITPEDSRASKEGL